MMNKKSYYHSPILLDEILNFFPDKDDLVVVDCTAGEGGHSIHFLRKMKSGKLLIIDRDKELLDIAVDRLSEYLLKEKKNIELFQLVDNFSALSSIFNKFKIEAADFIFYDLGISMYHFKGAERGFSFNDDSLDMRLDDNCSHSAYDVVNGFSENEIRNILFTLGDESWAKVIAREITQQRKNKKINTAKELEEIIYKSIPKKKRSENIHPATKSFQALRIFVNNELEHIKAGLSEGIKRLKVGARLGVLSFHSGEDRIVKQIFKHYSQSCICPESYPVCRCDGKSTLKILSKKPIVPTIEESNINPSARSSKLRVIEKVHEPSDKSWEISECKFRNT